jgi:hypothetical protein
MLTADKFFLRRKIIQILGRDYEIFDENGELEAFAHQKAFALKEEIICYKDKSQTEKIFRIKARNIIDIAATYDVFDANTDEHLGALRRKGLKSMFVADEWIILNSNDEEIGLVKEDDIALATLRRWLFSFLPQNYDGFIGTEYVADYKQNFNPFVYKLSIDFSKDTKKLLNRRMGLAMAILLAAIEGKQS